MDKNKPAINTLLNIDNIFGSYEGRVGPFVLTILLGSIPLWVWLFFLQGLVPLWIIIIIIFLLMGRLALIFIGKESEKMKSYTARRNDAYLESKDMVQVVNIYDDGLIEYTTGRVCYIVYGYLKGYLEDDALSVDLEAFLDELDAFDWDMNLYNVTDELMCTSELPLLRRYTDKSAILQRMNFYKYQDDWTARNTQMYELVFIVKARKYNWKHMRAKLEEITQSDVSNCFNEIHIADSRGVTDIMSRDIETYVDLNEMLLNKFQTDTIKGAKILYYDDKNIDDFRKRKEEGVNMKNRRTSVDENG